MPSIATPDTTGDFKITWDPTNPKDVENAREHFNDLKKKGHIFFRIESDGKKGSKIKKFEDGLGEAICEFDPQADVVATQLPVGG